MFIRQTLFNNKRRVRLRTIHAQNFPSGLHKPCSVQAHPTLLKSFSRLIQEQAAAGPMAQTTRRLPAAEDMR